MTQDSLARNLRVLRAKRGLNLTEASKLSGVTIDTLSALEHGERGAYTSTLYKLADAYGVTLGDLLGDFALVPAGKADAPETARSEPERPVQDPVHDLYGWVRDETTEDLKRRTLEEAQYTKAPVREEWVEERNADRAAWLEKGRRRTLAYTTIVAINAELERRGERSPVELAIKQYNEVMGSTDSIPQEAGHAEEEREGRSLSLIRELRAYLWDLRLRWLEPGHKPTPERIQDTLDLLCRLREAGAFEGTRTPEERVEAQLLDQAARKLRPIAEELVESREGAEDLRQKVDDVFAGIEASSAAEAG